MDYYKTVYRTPEEIRKSRDNEYEWRRYTTGIINDRTESLYRIIRTVEECRGHELSEQENEKYIEFMVYTNINKIIEK